MKKQLIFIFLLVFGFISIGTAYALPLGNDIQSRSTIDGATNIAFIDPTLVFSTAATIDSWNAYLKVEEGDWWAFQIYRPTTDPTQFTLVYHDQWYYGGTGYEGPSTTYPQSQNSTFEAQAGDIVGWWFGAGGGVIPFDFTSDPVDWTDWNSVQISSPIIGTTYEFNNDVWSNSNQHREYSIAVNYSPVSEPATILLISTGLVGLAAGAHRKLKKA